MKKSNTIPTPGPSAKRQESKKKRNRGLNYLESKGIDPIKYNQQTDALFQIKGITRFIKSKLPVK